MFDSSVKCCYVGSIFRSPPIFTWWSSKPNCFLPLEDLAEYGESFLVGFSTISKAPAFGFYSYEYYAIILKN